RPACRRRAAKAAAQQRAAPHGQASEPFIGTAQEGRVTLPGGGQQLLPAPAGRGRGSRRGEDERRLIGTQSPSWIVRSTRGRSVRSTTHLGRKLRKIRRASLAKRKDQARVIRHLYDGLPS